MRIRHLAKNGKPSDVVAVIKNNEIYNVFVEGGYNGLRHEHQCEALKANFKNNRTDRYIVEDY